MPDSFQPPNGIGNWKTLVSTLLMLTDPVFICRASAIALTLSRVQTLPDNPNLESLGFSSASAAARTVITGNVGPNVYTRMQSMLWSTSTSTVGS
jgi:hypothetical protein